MTTLDPSLSVRGKIIAALKADAQLTAIVPAARIYPGKSPASPTFPFIRVPMLIGTVTELDGGSGSEQSGVIHCFAKLANTSVPDPEAQAATINRHIVRIVSGIDDVDLGDGESLGVHATQTQVIEDGAEADAYHGMVTVRATAT
ncbi:tail completion protein gp17 [Sphingobium yanoikuyae]|uniref:tail completion protein gp17 n=1 Tax=Sphingobium yanoikuyae TaxID=13690 RepID=UPI0026EAD749|nr:DUF3168 domain-containing protein [Sphingobium yanoikuyae]